MVVWMGGGGGVLTVVLLLFSCKWQNVPYMSHLVALWFYSFIPLITSGHVIM